MTTHKSLFIKQGIFIFSLLLLSSCNSLKIKKITNQSSSEKSQLIYALHKDDLSIDIVLQKTKYTAGPFANYAEKYLSIKPQITKDKAIWNIKEIKLTNISKLDSSNLYLIEGAIQKILPENQKYITASGFPNIENYSTTSFDEQKIEEPEYLSFSLKKTIITDSKTDYKIVKTDSLTKKTPVVTKFVRNKTPEEKAADAASLIRKIRKRRFRLAAGMNENIKLDGTAVKEMIKELNLLEEKYLALFLGKSTSETKQIHLKYEISDTKGILGYWSLQNGWTNTKTKNAKPIYIEIEKPKILSFKAPEKEKASKFIPYRIPYASLVKISQDKKVIYQKTLAIAQFGAIRYLPVNQLKNTLIFK